MKHARFAFLGEQYPRALEAQFDRILCKIDELWDRPQIDDYFSDLVIDSRGGRQGFPKEVLDDILRLRDLRETETLRAAHEKEHARRELQRRGLAMDGRALVNAVKSGDQALVDLYVQAGVNANAADEDGTPALLVAMKEGYSIIGTLLIKAGADVNAKDRFGISPLLLACGKRSHGFTAIAQQLIQRGAYINLRDPLGNTPLLLALSGGTAEVAELLIERGADVNVRTRTGDTPLSLALRMGNPRVAEVLVGKGATQ